MEKILHAALPAAFRGFSPECTCKRGDKNRGDVEHSRPSRPRRLRRQKGPHPREWAPGHAVVMAVPQRRPHLLFLLGPWVQRRGVAWRRGRLACLPNSMPLSWMSFVARGRRNLFFVEREISFCAHRFVFLRDGLRKSSPRVFRDQCEKETWSECSRCQGFHRAQLHL